MRQWTENSNVTIRTDLPVILVYCSFNDTASGLDYTRRMSDDCLTKLKGYRRKLPWNTFKVLFMDMPGGTKVNKWLTYSGQGVSRPCLNFGSPEYEKVLSTDQQRYASSSDVHNSLSKSERNPFDINYDSESICVETLGLCTKQLLWKATSEGNVEDSRVIV